MDFQKNDIIEAFNTVSKERTNIMADRIGKPISQRQLELVR